MQRLGFHATLASRGLTIGALDLMLENAPFGVYVDHGVQGLVYANNALLSTYGLTWEAARGFGWAQVVLQDDRERLRAAITDFEHRQEALDIRFRIRTPSGEVRVIHSYVHAVLDDNGDRVGSLGILRDTTLEAVQQQRALVHQRKQAIGVLATRIAYRVNNTLQTVLAAEQALQNEPLSKTARILLKGMRESVAETANLARELAGLQAQAEESLVKLDERLRKRHPLYQELLGGQIHLQNQLDAPDATVGLSPSEFDQVVLHLLLTARSQLSGNGVLTLTTSATQNAVTVELHLGVNPDAPFDSLPLSAQADQLGRAAARSLLHRIGGLLHIGEQSLQLRLPLIEDRTTSSSKSLRILLVDDHTALRQSLATALALQGHTILTASSVFEALECLTDADLNSEPIDVVVTDLLLPDGDGTEVSEAACHQRPPATVVFMSGYRHDAVQMIHPIESDALFLQKPFTPRELRTAIHTAVQTTTTTRPSSLSSSGANGNDSFPPTA